MRLKSGLVGRPLILACISHILPQFEITPFLTFDYLGYNIRNWNATFGNTFGVQLKGQVWKQGPHAISLGADLGIAMNYLGFFDAAFQIGGPEVKYSHRWDNPRIAVIAGLKDADSRLVPYCSG
jgi:hypothetical protein